MKSKTNFCGGFSNSPAGGEQPLHEAEHRRKVGKKGEIVWSGTDHHAKRVIEPPDLSRSAGKSRFAGPSDRAPFLLVRFLWASKENEQKQLVAQL